MENILTEKRRLVIDQLIEKLTHSNRNDLENSLNASQILVELVETEKIFEIFMEDDAKRVARLLDLAIDCSNSFN